jgi:uncharacterized protein (TIGR02145 family)
MKVLILNLTFLALVSNFSFSQETGTFTDSRDGKVYKTVKIGTQTMMAENLACKPTKGNYWAYKNDTSNVAKFGYLYDWETAKIIAPVGWHLPTKDEWEKLYKYLGDNKMTVYKKIIPSGSSGFMALLGDSGGPYATFYGIGLHADFWSATPHGEEQACVFGCGAGNSFASLYNGYRDCVFSVRLFRD